MTGVINYGEINNLLSKFQNLKSDCEENTKAATSGIHEYKSAMSMGGSYEGEIVSLANKMSALASTLDSDYDRICRFLEKIASEAEIAHNQAITIMKATEIWNATETVTKG